MNQFYLLLQWDQLFWAICALLYVSDNFKSVGSTSLIFSERHNGQWAPILPFYNYEVAGRTFALLNPLTPWLLVCRISLFGPTSVSQPVQLRRTLWVIHRRLRGLRSLSIFLFVGLFILAPLATAFIGLGPVLIIFALAHCLALITLCYLLLLDRRRLKLSFGRMTLLLFESAICPGYFVNICRRVSLLAVGVPGQAAAYLNTDFHFDEARSVSFRAYFAHLRERGDIEDQDLAFLLKSISSIDADGP